MTAQPPYHGKSALSRANGAFLAARCRAYRKDYALTRKQAAGRCGVAYGIWSEVEAGRYCAKGHYRETDSAAAKIINVVLRVSPVCRKAESVHIQATAGASHVEESQAETDHR